MHWFYIFCLILIIIIVGWPVAGVLAMIAHSIFETGKTTLNGVMGIILTMVWPTVYIILFITKWKRILRYTYEWPWEKIYGLGLLGCILSVAALFITWTIIRKIVILSMKIGRG